MPTVFDVIRRLLPFGSNPTTAAIRAGAPLPPPAAGAGRHDWRIIPNWPPDVFAVTATLVNTAGCYAHPRYFGGPPDPAGLYFDPARRAAIVADGERWATPPAPAPGHPAPADAPREAWTRWLNAESAMAGYWWDLVLNFGDDPVEQRGDGCPRWWDPALYLMIAADEASAGFGFIARPDPAGGPGLDNFLYDQYVRYSEIRDQRGFRRDEIHRDFRRFVTEMLDPGPVRQPNYPDPIGPFLPYTPFSQCRAVTAAEACVQPKTQTSQVGCTVHTLSHHVALLPPLTEVRAKWMFALGPEEYTARDTKVDPLRLLLVPFPYAVPAAALSPGHSCSDDPANPARFFDLDQTWLRSRTSPVSPVAFADKFLIPLVRAAEKESKGPVHALVLPELALREDMIRPIALRLADKTGLEVFIAGAARPAGGGRHARNMVYGVLFQTDSGGRRRVYEDWHWRQAKHHRWRVDEGQLRTYGLAAEPGGSGGLSPGHDWWENIDVDGRECSFWVFRPGASVTTLICEDLARIEPVQRVVRAVGPNLLIALLMDGPQLPGRWPGKYAAVLADDPGSCVLSLTSLALVARSNKTFIDRSTKTPGNPPALPADVVALWSEPPPLTTERVKDGVRPTRVKGWRGTGPCPIALDPGHHAVLLNLTGHRATAFSADGRGDGNTTVRFHLDEVWQVKLPGAATRHPAWAARR